MYFTMKCDKVKRDDQKYLRKSLKHLKTYSLENLKHTRSNEKMATNNLKIVPIAGKESTVYRSKL